MPIFHGGDRSLDLKYLREPRTTGVQRFWYLWDVYILLITAMLFVAIAEAIPKPCGADATKAPAGAYTGTTVFFALLAGTLIFDSVVLVVDRFKSDENIRPRLSAYRWWFGLNVVMGSVCAAAAFATNASDTGGAAAILGHVVPLAWIFPTIAGIALARTAIDYYVGDDFLFP